MNNFIKFFFDRIFSLILILLLLPLFIIIIIFNYILQGKPIFFCQKRLGQYGKSFNMIKFRTMKAGPSISASDDEERLTSFGRLLRKFSIDELPTLINVLKFEMSIVGPRPMPIKYLNRFSRIHIRRLNVLPGITGLAQVNGRNKLSWEERFNLDIEYVKNYSIFLDMVILFKTFFIVILAKGVESANSEIMPEFMGSLEDRDDKS